MAYMNQERKKTLSPGIKAVFKRYAVKGSIAVRHHSTLVVNIREGYVDFAACVADPRMDDGRGYWQVNHYWIRDHWTGPAADFLSDLKDAMMVGNHDRSDITTDYFDVGWYITINVGRWDRPYKYLGRS